MKLFSSKRRVLVFAATAVLLLFLVRPGASRLKNRIILSISSAVGRPVDIGSVHLRFLPWPGFDLQNLVVYDDPSFGAEPILRSSEVTAVLRLTSLLRGRIEIARLDLNEPSLNLVHGNAGRWNLEALLERTSRTPLAPTAKAKAEPRPGFPYIEASSARINFKNGQEKKPYALTNADFSLWQESENSWGIRLKAQPFRSDMNLSDVGMLQVSGSWQRAASLQTTPVQLTTNWSRAQLGQVTKFFSGNDQGWRGAADLDLTLSGTPANLQIANTIVVQDFRRYDITSGNTVRLAVQCTAKYASAEHTFENVDCQSPVGNGLIRVKGSLGLPASHTYNVVFTAEDVPARSALVLLERVKKNLPNDLAAEGKIEGSFSMVSGSGFDQPHFEGRGQATGLKLISSEDKAQVGPETVPFLLTDGAPLALAKRRSAALAFVPAGPRVEFGPVQLADGRGVGPSARGWLNRAGYGIAFSGGSDITRVLRLARMAGVPALPTTAEGMAQVDLQIAGSWMNSSSIPPVASGPEVIGTVRLHNVRVSVHGSVPTEITSADLQLAPDAVHVRNLAASAAGSLWSGSLDLPRGCGTPASCQVQFDLKANQLSLRALSDWANPNAQKRPWYRVLEDPAPAAPPFLASLRASGHIAADRLQVEKISSSRASANVELENGKLAISQFTADVFQGKHAGQWHADFTSKPGVCAGNGKLTGVSLAQLAQVMNDGWILGSASGTYEVKGDCTEEFWSTAEGALSFDIRDGMLPHVTLTEGGDPLRLTRVIGQARLQDGKLELKNAKLDSAGSKYEVTGTASFGQELNLKLVRAAGSYTIDGTISEPRVRLTAGTEQAKLKTDPSK